jgi:CO/xanthine dehydrogenase Mo-binding subunit
MTDFSIIGKPTAMIDAAEKTTGGGKYTDDLSVPGMLVGKILHSPYPHARIKRLDTSRAEKLEGVVTVAVGQDAPNPFGILPVGHDEHALALEKVRYVGDNVACVVAVSEAIAEKALELIDVEYELLPAYFDPEESMKAETDLIHDRKPHNLERLSPCVRRSRQRFFGSGSYCRGALHRERSNARGDGAAFLAILFRTRSAYRQARTAHRVVVDAGAVLLATQAFSRPRNADVADSRDQAAGRRRIRGQERSDPA